MWQSCKVRKNKKKVYFSHIQQSNEILLADVKREGVLKESINWR